MSNRSRVTIPNSARKTIQNIREIAGNHSDEEIYAMLQECSMDPNETAQKLLLQDTFHEVKRKRDRRKETRDSNIPNNREPADTRWRPGSQGRGSGRGGRGNYSSRYGSHDANGGRNASIGKENGAKQVADKSITSAPVPVGGQDTENNSMATGSSSAAGLANGPTKVEHPISAQECTSKDPDISGTFSLEVSSSLMNKIGMQSSDDVKSSTSGVYVLGADPVQVSSLDAHNPIPVGAIIREVGSQRSALKPTIDKIVSDASKMSHSVHGKMPSKCQEFDVNQLPNTSQSAASSYINGSVSSRPSSNYNNRSQQQSGSQRAAGPTKEWKPKSTIVNPSQASEKLCSCDVEDEAVVRPQSASSSTTVEDSTSKLQNLQFSEVQHVIIPDHLQVPEFERTGLSFGSFDATFSLGTRVMNGPNSDKSPTHLSEPSQEIVENAEESSSSNQNASLAAQVADYPEPHTPEHMSENLLSREPDLSNTSPLPEYDQSRSEEASASEGPHYSVVHTAPTFSNFAIPQMLGSQLAPVEGAEPQSRDASRLSSFVVQQPFDPTNFYTPIYRPTADGAFLAPNTAVKYNGNIAVLPSQTGQSPQENGNSLVLSSTGPTPPVFRQPGGVHMSHFPPNCVPYSQYFSPFYVPPPTIHHFLSNAPFPQQPPAGSMYPPPSKYSISQYKPSSGMPAGSEDLSSSQYKENNVYITGQQTEGSPVWIPATGRDVSALQATSFYNLPQGQHLAFAPTQPGHGAFGMYHPAQTVAGGGVHMLSPATPGAVEMAGLPAGVYQQPHRAPINWTSNY